MFKNINRMVGLVSILALLSGPVYAAQISTLSVDTQHALREAAGRGPDQLTRAVQQAVAKNPRQAQSIVNYAAQFNPSMGTQLAKAANVTLTQVEKVMAAELSAAKSAAAAAAAPMSTTAVIAAGAIVVAGAGAAYVALEGDDTSNDSYNEFGAQWGLRAIGAQSAYARGATGDGILVGVLDSGIDDDFYEFTDRIASGGQNFIGGRDPNNITDSPLDGHGTHVSGIIAANKDGRGMHGVAYGATVLPLRTFEVDSNGVDYGAVSTEVANAINYGISQNVKVYNGSYGYDVAAPIAGLQTELDAFEDAIAGGAVLVFATGNDSYADPAMPAAFPFIQPSNNSAGIYTGNTGNRDYSAAASNVLAVMSIDQSGTASSFSNYCGVAAAWCLAAPGGNIYSTMPDNTYINMSGTSMAAPHVAGAVALVMDMYPTLTGDQVVTRILTTATKTGIYADSSIYGQGLLNLNTATSFVMRPMMMTGNTISSTSFDLDESRIELASAFGDGLSASLAGQQLTIVDSFDGAGMTTRGSELVKVSSSTNTIDDGLRRFGRRADVQQIDGVVTGTLTLTEVAGNDDHRAQQEARFTTRLTADTSVSVGFMNDPALGLGLVAGGSFSPTESRTRSAFSSPYLSFAEDGTNFVAETKFDGITVRSASFFGRSDEDDDENDTRSFGAATEMQFSAFGNSTINMQAGFLRETASFLGSQTDGATAMGETNTLFGGMSFAMPINSKIDLLGSYFLGSSSAEGADGSLVNNFSGVTSDAMSLGVVHRDFAMPGDRLGFVVNQPLRVSGGSASLRLPSGLTRDGDTVYVGYSNATAGLTPTGREVDVEAFYSASLNSKTDINASLMYRHQPDHVADAEGEMQALVRLNRKLGN